jgi:hypothetical protein
MKKKTYFQQFQIRRPYRGFQMCEEYEHCPLCDKTVQLCQVGMMRDFRFNWKRCSYCLVKIPLPKYIITFLNKHKKKELPKGQMTLA